MKASEVGKTAYSMPLTKPGYPKGREAGGQLSRSNGGQSAKIEAGHVHLPNSAP